MVIYIIVVILLITAALSCYGIYIIVHNSNKEKEKEGALKIAMSGKYAAALRPIAEVLAEKKPAKAEVQEWLNSQAISEEQKKKSLENWQNSINKTIKTIDEGDANGITAYRIEVGEKDRDICQFLHQDNFLTRQQLGKYAELLPPYCIGSDSVVVPKQPWDNADGTGGWKSVMPKDGRYEVPDWKRMLLIMLAAVFFVACASPYILTDRSGSTFIIENPELEPIAHFEYRAGNAIRELSPEEIVLLSMPNAEPKIFDGKVFYPATLALEDTLSVPSQGFICVEGLLKAQNAGKNFSIKIMNIKELQRKKEMDERAATTATQAAAIAPETTEAAEPAEATEAPGTTETTNEEVN
ncbi:MAG: hypothetical protein LBH25_07080 [Fibromonadaceae bacterium]|jgi:hypothetical protein|nr:hypothetical protein [Fibromonadaceae bacterium]